MLGRCFEYCCFMGGLVGNIFLYVVKRYFIFSKIIKFWFFMERWSIFVGGENKFDGCFRLVIDISYVRFLKK